MGGSCTVAHDDHQNSQASRQRQRLAYVVLAEAQVHGDDYVTLVTSGALLVHCIVPTGLKCLIPSCTHVTSQALGPPTLCRGRERSSAVQRCMKAILASWDAPAMSGIAASGEDGHRFDGATYRSESRRRCIFGYLIHQGKRRPIIRLYIILDIISTAGKACECAMRCPVWHSIGSFICSY